MEKAVNHGDTAGTAKKQRQKRFLLFAFHRARRVAVVKKLFIRPYILRVNVNPSPHLPLPGHPLPQGERESKRLLMPCFLYIPRHISLNRTPY
ncbi:hypothetical protein AGMMS50256_22840 [Betaproteobacteria bacterium]|nr:hypothetical protein AGMMS50256_22840 [Betaproteobacteria bacterium]